MRSMWLIVVACLAVAGCGDDAARIEAEKARQAAAATAFAAEQQAWREQRRAELLEPDGWSSVISLIGWNLVRISSDR